ncbi:hypothetical protein J6Z39_10650 [bacterium]|nr:hypothetical protein [bacterium]MBR6245450.1 hypothetical protein [bacterium]
MSNMQPFFGRKEYRIDSKGRISLSSDYFSLLELQDKNTVVVAQNSNESHRFLEVFSQNQWNEQLKVIDCMEDDEDKEWLMYNYVGTAISVELDTQNRIRLPKSLIDYAKIGQDVVFIGAIKTLRIWSKSELADFESSQKHDRESIRTKMNAARKLYSSEKSGEK